MSHKGCDRVQDMYSLRCIPQVHGGKVFNNRKWINSVSDIVLPIKMKLFFGHFHAEIVQALDTAAIVIYTISEEEFIL